MSIDSECNKNMKYYPWSFDLETHMRQYRERYTNNLYAISVSLQLIALSDNWSPYRALYEICVQYFL